MWGAVAEPAPLAFWTSDATGAGLRGTQLDEIDHRHRQPADPDVRKKKWADDSMSSAQELAR